MTWREFACYVRGLPQDCRLARSITGEKALWGPQERMLADIFDVLAHANWQRQGDKHASRPKPYPRPMDKRATEALGLRLRRLRAKGDHDRSR